MILAEELRKSVLQAALQGKLSKQLASDSSVIELLSDIEKKLKKKINTQYQEKFLLKIPSCWEYIKLGDVLNIARGGSPRPIKEFITTSKDGVNWIKIGDTDIGGKYINSTAEKIKPEGIKKSRFVFKGDFLLTNSMSFGRPYILNIDGCIHDGWLVLHDENNCFNKDYLYYLLSSQFVYEQFTGKVTGAVVKNLNTDKVSDTIVPLPPLEEQQRIVEKIEKLMKKIDEYALIENELQVLKTKFPREIRNSILQAAIQGKLTKQFASDSSVDDYLIEVQNKKNLLIKEKKLLNKKKSQLIDSNELFDIPNSWRWVRFGDIVDFKLGKTPPRSDSKFWGRDYKWISISDMVGDSIIEDTKEGISQYGFENSFGNQISPKGTLIMSFKLTVGKVSILGMDALHNEAIISIFPFIDIDNTLRNYLFKILPFVSKFADTKNAIKGNTLNSISLNDLLIPLPPVEEQQRIIEKLNAILPICEDLIEE